MEPMEPLTQIYNTNMANTLVAQNETQQFYRQITYAQSKDLAAFPNTYGEYKLAGLGHPEIANVAPAN